jgi:hypothetical protein
MMGEASRDGTVHFTCKLEDSRPPNTMPILRLMGGWSPGDSVMTAWLVLSIKTAPCFNGEAARDATVHFTCKKVGPLTL